MKEARTLVQAVRDAAAVHRVTWEALVPNHLEINLDAEPAEDAAYAEMARAKKRLRDHLCDTYGISARELASLALP
ncbi:hypothetical protein ACFOMD_00470 [Sphingoaurantiacus capsulatus]|uniref:Uncharacterized protein n=1 Tax=Sphingoaurantiacus capsulatus TaxID=1771310 RepID=A0ABV7X4Z0_9SPHN